MFIVSGKKYGRHREWKFPTFEEAQAKYDEVIFERGWDTLGISETSWSSWKEITPESAPIKNPAEVSTSEKCYEQLAKIRKKNWLHIYKKLSEEFKDIDPHTKWELRDSAALDTIQRTFLTLVNKRQDPFMIAARVMKAFGASRPFKGANHRMGLKAATTIMWLCGYEVDYKQALNKADLFSLSDKELREYFYISAMYASRLRAQSSSQIRDISFSNSSSDIDKRYGSQNINTFPPSNPEAFPGCESVSQMLDKLDDNIETATSEAHRIGGVSEDLTKKMPEDFYSEHSHLFQKDAYEEIESHLETAKQEAARLSNRIRDACLGVPRSVSEWKRGRRNYDERRQIMMEVGIPQYDIAKYVNTSWQALPLPIRRQINSYYGVEGVNPGLMGGVQKDVLVASPDIVIADNPSPFVWVKGVPHLKSKVYRDVEKAMKGEKEAKLEYSRLAVENMDTHPELSSLASHIFNEEQQHLIELREIIRKMSPLED